MLHAKEQRSWTEAERETVKKLWRKRTDSQIADAMDRTLWSVRHMRHRLELKHETSGWVRGRKRGI